MINSDLIQLGFCQNRWIWFHLLGALIVSKVLISLNMSPILGVGILALATEAVELGILYDNTNTKFSDNIVRTYGSIKNYLYDTTGDLIGAFLVSIIMIF